MAMDGTQLGDPVDPREPVQPSSRLDDTLRSARTAEQVQAIVDALGGTDVVGVVAARPNPKLGGLEEYSARPEDYGDMLYMFRRGRILVRDQDLSRVLAVPNVRVRVPDVPDGINGLTVLEADDTLATLAAIDGALGTGVGYPDHVVHVTDGHGGSACPATEPWPPLEAKPWPTRDAHGSCDGGGVLVALVDAGFDPALAADTAWLAGVDGTPELYDPDHIGPYTGHGTFAAGVVRQMAPGCAAYVHGFLPHGGAQFESDVILDGFAKALRTAPDIVSISAGTYSREDHGMLGFRVAWEQFGSKGTAVIAAAGNDGWRKPFFPAADWYAVGVGALVPSADARAHYSNYGSWVDCYAIGSDHVNAFPRGTYDYRQPPMKGRFAHFRDGLARWSGTSFSTPLVSGVVAARMTWSGESGREAAQSVLRLARENARPHVGAIVEPWMACKPDGQCQ